MNTRIFRKVSLERLSSPEQLDEIIRISSSKSWAALLAIVLLSGVGIVWAVQGSIPTTARGKGMIVRTGGVLNVVSRGSGLVLSMHVTVGQHVKANQVIARIAQPALIEKMRGMKQGLTETRLKQERELNIRNEAVKLQVDVLARQRQNREREIKELQEQLKLAEQQVPVIDQLYSKGLVTKQQTISIRQKLIEIQGLIEDRNAQLKQLDAQQYSAQSQVQRDESDMKYEISKLEREMAIFEKELSLVETVVSPYAGEVLEVKVSAGGSVVEGAPMISIQPEVDTLEALVYISSLQAKDAKPGMEIQVSPSTVKREEFGFIKGKIAFVADYPATQAALMRNFQNEALVSALTSSGPVTEIRVILEKDPDSISGFKWSSPKGAPVKISGGTFCDADVVTRRRAPITLLLPSLKDTLGVS